MHACVIEGYKLQYKEYLKSFLLCNYISLIVSLYCFTSQSVKKIIIIKYKHITILLDINIIQLQLNYKILNWKD